MDQSRESLQTRIQALKDPSVRELVRDVVDSAWQWSRGQVGKQAQERWVIVGGQAVRGTTENEKAPPQNGGQSDGQGQTHPITGGPAGPAGPAGPIGPAGPQGDVGPAGPTIGHDLLPGLNDGDYQHLTALQLADLTDGGDSVAHFHSSDRDRANHTGTQMASTISDFAATADGRIALQKGAASGLAPLDSGSKVPLSYLPATTIVETSVVASQAAMLALTAQQGDVAVRTDLSKTFILKADPASILGNWQEMLSPTDGVQSVGLSAPALMTSGGGPVTNTGTLSLAWNGPSSDIVRADGSVVSGTTNFGRSLLTLADAAAARTAIGAQAAGSYQPLDPDLTAVAALATTGFVRRTAADAWAASVLVWGDIASGHPSVTAGTGMIGGGSLTGSVTLAVSYGTAAGTAAQGNDSRILNGQTAFGWGNHASAGYAFATHSHGDLTFRDGAVWRNWTGNGAHGVNYKMLYAGGVTPGDSNYSFGFSHDGSHAWINGGASININVGGNLSVRAGTNEVTVYRPLIGTSATFSGAVTGSNLAIANWNTAHTHSQIASGNPHGTTFASLVAKPTTLAGYGITDAVGTSDSRLTDARTPINNDNYVQGINSSRSVELTNFNTVTASTFASGNSATGSPAPGWHHLVNVKYTGTSINSWNFQIAAGFGPSAIGAPPENYFVRIQEGTNWKAWRTLWHSGNLVGTRNEHNHLGIYHPLEDQRLSSYDEVAFARVRSSSILPVDVGGADEIGGYTDMWTSAHLKTVRTNRVLVAFGGTPSVAFNPYNYLEMTSIDGVCGYLVGRQGGVQTFDLGGQYGNLRLASSVGVFGQYGPAGKPKVVGSKGGNVALAALISALVQYGFIEDLTT